jgi:hypothetical protein
MPTVTGSSFSRRTASRIGAVMSANPSTALRGLLDAVAPGGTLLIASHDPADLSPRHEHGYDPSDYYQPDDIARLLDHNWTVLINETRPRTAPTPAGTHHTHDTVLRAQRLR